MRRAVSNRVVLQLLLVVVVTAHGVLVALPHTHEVAVKQSGPRGLRAAAADDAGYHHTDHGCVACAMAASAHAVAFPHASVCAPEPSGYARRTIEAQSSDPLTTDAKARAPPTTFHS